MSLNQTLYMSDDAVGSSRLFKVSISLSCLRLPWHRSEQRRRSVMESSACFADEVTDSVNEQLPLFSGFVQFLFCIP